MESQPLEAVKVSEKVPASFIKPPNAAIESPGHSIYSSITSVWSEKVKLTV